MRLGLRKADLLLLICLPLAVPSVAVASYFIAGLLIAQTTQAKPPATGPTPPRHLRESFLPVGNEPPDAIRSSRVQPHRGEIAGTCPPRGEGPLDADEAPRTMRAVYLAPAPRENPVRIRVNETHPPQRLAAQEPSHGTGAELHPTTAVPEPSPPPETAPLPQQPAAPAPAGGLDPQIPFSAIEYLRETFSGTGTPAPDAPPASAPSSALNQTVKIPLSGSVAPDDVRVDSRNNTVSIVVRDAPLNEVLGILAQHLGLNLITAEDVTANVSVTLSNVSFEQALTNMLAAAGYTWSRQEDVLIVTSMTAGNKLPPHVQGRETRMFALDYASATDVDLVIKGLLSPAGQSFVTQSTKTDDRRTQELLVVEDLLPYLDRIEQTIRLADQPPRQVLIEAYVMSIELDNDVRHGVNLEYLDQIGVPSVTLKAQGFADAKALATPGTPAFLLNVAATDVKSLLEALETTKDAKTLAQPKVLALNGQEARIQIGEKLAYRVTTSTETSTMESVDFLDVGVVLTVTPRVTRDNSVIMTVKPEVSSGEINTTTQLPDSATTEVETSLMLPDGHGMVIGGLIQEEDIEKQTKVPIIGDLWLIGRLFQKRELERNRREIIIALIPHIVPFQSPRYERECEQFSRAVTPLLYGPLLPNPRTFEPRFPDAGQIMPIRYKTRHFCATPDDGYWHPAGPREPCVPTGQNIPAAYDDPVFFPQGAPSDADLPEHGEMIPPPSPQPLR